MIKTKNELKFYIAADRMMNRGSFHQTLKAWLKDFIVPDYTMSFLVTMRKCQFYNGQKGLINRCKSYYYKIRLNRLSFRLGFSIGTNVFGYGLVIPHFGTIVVGPSNKIGNYAVLHTSTCISDNGKIIGDGLYLSTGAKITSKCQIGNNVSIGANSLVNKSFLYDNILIGGVPAKIIKNSEAWYVRDGETYLNKVKKIEQLRKKMGINS